MEDLAQLISSSLAHIPFNLHIISTEYHTIQLCIMTLQVYLSSLLMSEMLICDLKLYSY